LVPSTSLQFTLEVGVAATNCKNNTKTPNFKGTKSFKVTDVDTTTNCVTIGCYDKQHVCGYV